MQHDVIFAGFGGQGVLLIGKMLAYAGLHAGKEVSWLPSYGPEMRGGTANCTVVISDHPVGSPVILAPKSLVVMNQPSLDKFEPTVKPGGLIVVNTSLCPKPVTRTDLTVVAVPANEMAMELKNPKGANMIVLGAFVGATNVIDLKELDALVRETFAAKPQVVDANLAALAMGHELGAAAVEGGK